MKNRGKMICNTIFGIIGVVAIVLVIYDVIVNNKRLSHGMNLLWVILTLLFSIIIALVYYFIGRDRKNDLFRKKIN